MFCSAFGAVLIPPYVSIPVYIPPYFNSIVVELRVRDSFYFHKRINVLWRLDRMFHIVCAERGSIPHACLVVFFKKRC